MMSKLSGVLLVEAVREYALKFGELEQSWLRGLSDPGIGRALTLRYRRDLVGGNAGTQGPCSFVILS